jgi:hypothetical protein
MVMRKPVPPNANTAVGADKSDLPYPATPTAADAPPTLAERNPRCGSPYSIPAEPDSQDDWGSEQAEKDGLPASLKAAAGRRSMEGSQSGADDLPESLRVGRPGYTPSPRSSTEMQRPTVESTNPYIQRQQTGMNGTSDGRESSASAWGGFTERPPIPSSAPPPPPVPKGKSLLLCGIRLDLGSPAIRAILSRKLGDLLALSENMSKSELTFVQILHLTRNLRICPCQNRMRTLGNRPLIPSHSLNIPKCPRSNGMTRGMKPGQPSQCRRRHPGQRLVQRSLLC